MHVINIQNLTRDYGAGKGIFDVSIQVRKGEVFGFLGPNGAGKTTTIRILMDVFPAEKGNVLIDGAPINYNEIKIGYLPEERGLYPKKKIIDQLVYFAALHGMKSKEAVKAADYWLERLDMTQYRNKRLDTLSKGNQQKIQLITALAHNPEIVILDEPFSGLDPVNAMLLKDVVKEEIAKGKIVLFSSHQMSYIEEFCSNIAIINQGEIVLKGNLHDIKHNYTRDKLILRSDREDEILSDLKDISSRTETGEVLIQLDSPDRKREMMQYLTEKYDIDELKVFEPSLNDIFVEYTGGEEKGGEKE